VRLYRTDPAVEFFLALSRRREALAASFNAAIASNEHASRADIDYLNATFARTGSEGDDDYGLDLGASASPEQLAEMFAAADSLDSSANVFAAVVILVLDDILQKYAAALRLPRGVHLSFGKDFDGVALTTLLAAAGNNFRHARSWGNVPWPDPRPGNEGDYKQAWDSMRPLIRALHLVDPIHDYITRATLIVLAVNVGAGQPSYAHLEALLVEAAKAMASCAGRSALSRFDAARNKVDAYLRLGQIEALF
jgi:hypothetical protein